MTKKRLYALWGGLFGLCAVLGFVRTWMADVSAPVQALFVGISLVFFLPPAVLVYRANREGDLRTLAVIRGLSLASLILTAVLLVLNLVTAMGSQAVGDLLHGILVVVSTPMVCSGYWVLSLFLWACLLMTTLKLMKK